MCGSADRKCGRVRIGRWNSATVGYVDGLGDIAVQIE